MAVVVADPGHVGWFAFSAVAHAEQGRLASYVRPLTTNPGEAEGLLSKLPEPLAARAREQLIRRPLHPGIPGDSVRTAATRWEVVSIAAKRVRAPRRISARVADQRDRAFDRAVAKLLPGASAAQLAYGCALESISQSIRLDVEVLLEHPVHHHSFNEHILQQELRLAPDYARSMQFHDPGERRIRRMDEEIRLADRIVVLSDFSKRTFVEAGVDEARIDVVPLGVDSKLFRPRDPEDDRFRVLFSGPLTQRKGLSYLVEGFRRAAIPDSELILVGAVMGGCAPWQGIEGVQHVPWLRTAELAEAMSSCSVLVLPSLVEGFARTALEAMACGLPVILTPNTGAAQIIEEGKNGFVVPVRDADAIAERLRALAHDPHQRSLIGAAARATAERYPWERYGESMAALTSR